MTCSLGTQNGQCKACIGHYSERDTHLVDQRQKTTRQLSILIHYYFRCALFNRLCDIIDAIFIKTFDRYKRGSGTHLISVAGYRVYCWKCIHNYLFLILAATVGNKYAIANKLIANIPAITMLLKSHTKRTSPVINAPAAADAVYSTANTRSKRPLVRYNHTMRVK
eukprot:Pompholyxophrys_punicea_v1_NODE_38_length_4733_cov_3.558572.p6 type:complete len:166 gc:universal NODE_38_length_4733_cov_3.558572:3812-4309(+)